MVLVHTFVGLVPAARRPPRLELHRTAVLAYDAELVLGEDELLDLKLSPSLEQLSDLGRTSKQRRELARPVLASLLATAAGQDEGEANLVTFLPGMPYDETVTIVVVNLRDTESLTRFGVGLDAGDPNWIVTLVHDVNGTTVQSALEHGFLA